MVYTEGSSWYAYEGLGFVYFGGPHQGALVSRHSNNLSLEKSNESNIARDIFKLS